MYTWWRLSLLLKIKQFFCPPNQYLFYFYGCDYLFSLYSYFLHYLWFFFWKKSLTTCVIAFYPFLFKIGKIKTEFMWQIHWLKSSLQKNLQKFRVTSLVFVVYDVFVDNIVQLFTMTKRWSDGYYSFNFESSFIYEVKGETVFIRNLCELDFPEDVARVIRGTVFENHRRSRIQHCETSYIYI